MKKAANILFLIGGVYALVGLLSLVVTGVLLIVFSTSGLTDVIKQAIIDGSIQTSYQGTIEEVTKLVQITLLTSGIIVLCFVPLCIVSSILSFKARNSRSHGLFIANIVFGVLSGNDVSVVGAIFALIKGDTIEQENLR